MDGPEIPKHYDDLEEVRRAAWDALVRGANSRKSAMHQVSVATVDGEGMPAARTVVLRDADRAEWTLRFHTDTRSRKYSELQANDAAVVLAYDHGAKVQIRARGRVTLHNRDERTASIWAGMRDMSKACYRQAKGPGEPLSQPGGAEGEPLSDAEGYANFVVALVRVDALEWLYLAAQGHRRARLTAQSATWLAP